MRGKILLVDDDSNILELLKYNLEKENYILETASDGHEAYKKALEFLPDLIIMDYMMPTLDGVSAAKLIKKETSLANAKILFLTARSDENTEILAFEAGAHDFISKPIKPKILLHRINVHFSDFKPKAKENNVLKILDIEINPNTYSVTRGDGKNITLPKKEFQLLLFLAQNPNRVYDRDYLLSEIWEKNVFVVDRTVDVHIRKVREKVGEKYIKTIKGVGYMFSEE